MPHPDQHPLAAGRRISADPMQVGKGKAACGPAAAAAHHHPVRPGILPRNEPRPPREAEPTPLPDGKEPVPAVGPDLGAGGFVHHRTRPHPEVGGDEVPVADVPQEADSLAVRSVPRRESEPGRELPDLGLGQLAHREQRAFELAEADAREEVGLILDRVGRPPEFAASFGLDPARVVPGRHPLEPPPRDLGVHPVGKGAELDAGVAEKIGTRGAAAFEFGEQIGNHPFPIGALERNHRERNPELVGYLPGVAEVLLPGALSEVIQFVLQPDLQIEGMHLVALLHQPGQGDGAVHPSGDENGDAHGDPKQGPALPREPQSLGGAPADRGMMTLGSARISPSGPEDPSMAEPPSNHANARLLAIWAKGARGKPMMARPEGELIPGEGLRGSAPVRGKRQVTVLSREAWERAAREAGQPEVDPALRRANLLVTGVDFRETGGRTLAIGETRILIHGETKPCDRMDAGALRLRETLSPEWRAGAFGEVVSGGRIRIGDPVGWAEADGA